MKGIHIYWEGGGDTAHQRAEFRKGLQALLKPQGDALRKRRLSWQVIACGGRNATCDDFLHDLGSSDGILRVLLVDSEEAIPHEEKIPENLPDDQKQAIRERNASARRDHLIRRDGWKLAHVPAEQIHLMVQCMEAWIVADPDALSRHYGKRFDRSKLPNRDNLEDEPKPRLYEHLNKATQPTPAGPFLEGAAKCRIAPKLLAAVRPEQVALRCPRFATLIHWLDQCIAHAPV
jgi:hypothetical protein